MWVSRVKEGDVLEVDIKEAKIEITRNKSVKYRQKISENSLETLKAGGLINKVRKQFDII